MGEPASNGPEGRLVEVVLDERTIGRADPDIEHERAVAIFDLVAENTFHPAGHQPRTHAEGRYHLSLSIAEKRLCFAVSLAESGAPICTHFLSLTPFRRAVHDYKRICDSYYDAIRASSHAQIEAIDMARRGLHNDGSETLRERLDGKIEVDLDTARRLFTLICALDWTPSQ